MCVLIILLLYIYIFYTVRDHPSNIEVNAEYPGSPCTKIGWLFPGESSDLTNFCVKIKQRRKEETSLNALSSEINVM